MASPSLLDLVRAGTLPLGTKLYHRRPRHPEQAVTAVVVAGGMKFRGAVYKTPSGAALAAAGNAQNGWQYWRLRDGDQPLADLRTTA